MTEVERYLKFQEDRDTLVSRLNSLPAEIAQLLAELDPLLDQAVRAEIQGDRTATNHRVQIDKSKQQIEALESEKKTLAHRSKVMGDLIAEHRGKAAAELAGVHDKAFRKAVKEFAAALRAAQRAEVDLVKVFNAAHTAFGDIGTQSPLPTWDPQFVRGCQDAEMNQKLLNFLDRFTAQGFDVSK